jgi:hypothetical protein
MYGNAYLKFVPHLEAVLPCLLSQGQRAFLNNLGDATLLALQCHRRLWGFTWNLQAGLGKGCTMSGRNFKCFKLTSV